MEDERAGERPGLRKSQLAYGLFDWASSPVPTLHATFVFAVYYVTSVSPENGSAQWAWMNALAAITVALLCPFLGARADAHASRKQWLFTMTLTAALATALLWWIRPEPAWIWPALALSYVSLVAMESQFTFYNALLPSVSTPSTIGRVSGFSWAAGYTGAIVCLVLVLRLFILPETPALGLDKESAEHIRVTMPFAAVWFLVFAVPLFLWVGEGPAAQGQPGVLATLLEGLHTARSVPGLLRFLVARMIYADGLIVVFAFGGIYAANVFGFTQQDVIAFAIAINLTAGAGAALIGWLEDQIGGFNTVRLSLLCLLILAGHCAPGTEPALLLDFRIDAGLFHRAGAVREPHRGGPHRAVRPAGPDFRVVHDFRQGDLICRPPALRHARHRVRHGPRRHVGRGRVLPHQLGDPRAHRAR